MVYMDEDQKTLFLDKQKTFKSFERCLTLKTRGDGLRKAELKKK